MQIKEYRERAKLSQAELAKKLNISEQTVRAYECGYRKTNKMSLETALKLCKILGMKIEEI